jgi:general secretion pathway protein H
LELLIVVAVIALASGLAILALRDPASTRLEQEATRLAALLDAARLESRISGQPVTWRPRPTGKAEGAPQGTEADFQFEPSRAVISGLPSAGPAGGPAAQATGAWPTQWLHPGTSAEIIGAARVVLGPEPLIAPQRVRLRLGEQQRVLATDGLGGFRVEAGP